MITRILPVLFLLLGCTLGIRSALPEQYEELKAEAEKHYRNRSYALAHDRYAKASLAELPDEEKRWVEFRLADSQWRSQAATEQSDTTKLDEARQKLEALVRDLTRVEQRDRVWAEVQESLADFHWTRRHNNNWGTAWPLYQQVLDWWAGAAELETARARYLQVVWRMARPPLIEPHYYYGYWGNYIPLEILENALKISRNEDDKAHAHYLIAMTLRNQGGDWFQQARVPDEFEAALKQGTRTDWYDDALYNYAEWMAGHGRIIFAAEGNWRSEPDYVKALGLFRRVVSEFSKGETRFWEQAQQQIKNITDPQVTVSVASVFLPDSEIQYFLNWRNVKQIELALYPVELNRDVDLARGEGNWLHSINTGGLERIKSWTRDTRDTGEYKPGQESVRLEEKLKPGAYLIEAKAGGKSARDLILVSDAALVLKASGKQALVYFCNALNSEPLGGAKFKLWERWHDGRRWLTRSAERTAGADGVAVFELSRPANHHNLELFAGAILKDRQAFSSGQSYGRGAEAEPWRIYAFTDRPAYRPNEKVQWKFLARRYDGSRYSTPAETTIEFQIDDPRGSKLHADTVKLNAFGSAWGSLDLNPSMPLGEYRVTFWDQGRQRVIGSATLFRLEEYKLPEFKVSVQTPEQDGRKKSFRLGEKVEVNVQADYYFGGPVANANVEVVVYQNPFYHHWQRPREFPWFYEDLSESRWGRGYGGNGQIVKRETVKTDAAGKATVVFETPRDSGQDFQYRIEARVTDASRREIIGNGNVRVTRQRYYVYPQADHNLYRPQDKVRVEFKALDANEQPVQTEALVKVTRDYWFEIWLDPDGKEVKGEELQRQRATSPAFPPPPLPGRPGWRLKFRGYEHDEILTRALKTDTNGLAELSFTPEREGYYRVAWSSDAGAPGTNRAAAPPAQPVRAETTVWVATGATTELGYRHGGVEIIADRDTFRVGQKSPVMLVAPANDRHVLFTVEGDDLYSYQLVHLEGTVKLVELAIEEKHVPNLFLSATLVHDRQIFTDTKQLIVPPTKNFLKVEVKADRPQYQPREEGTLSITTVDDQGKGVPAEVSLSLVDESVFYIQQDYAGDPRAFYFGTKRQQQVQTASTMNYKRYARLVPGEQGELIDDRQSAQRRSGSARRSRSDYYYSEDERLAETDAAALFDINGPRGGAAGRLSRLESKAQLGAAETAPAAAPMRNLAKADGKDKLAVAREMLDADTEAPVQVRSDFRSTIFWKPDVVTDRDGKAVLKVTYPDSVTGWKATARAATAGNQFGLGDTGTRTQMPLIVRLQAPRFFVVGDTVTLSAVLNNNTDETIDVKLALEVAGGLQLARPGAAGVKVPAHGENRLDWTAEVAKPGEVKIKVTGRGGKYSDAMERSYLAYEHGIEKFLAKSGKAKGDEVLIKLDLPRERKPGSTSLAVQVTPSMAVTMLDALPYLIHYPYGCTEQTMSRFLPAAITAKTLRDLGLQPEDVMGRWFGGIEPGQAAATHPQGKKDLAELDRMVKAGLERLYDFQHADGGWGWWKEGESDPWMTAYVVWGLTLAKEAGVAIQSPLVDRGAGYLDKTLVEQELNFDMQAWMLHALAVYDSSRKGAATTFQEKAFGNLWTNREKLNAYTRALLALAAHHFGKAEQAKTLLENLENGVKRDERPDASVLVTGTGGNPATLATAHWGEDGIYWRWSEGGVEATAFALRALLTIDPQNKLVEPVTNWLIKNRRGAQWNSTRDTAIVVLALNDYLRASGELKAGIEYELTVNGSVIARKKISGADLFEAPSRFAVDANLIRDANEIRLRRRGGDGALYFAVEAKFFSLEEPIAAVGNEIFVKRQYHKLVGRPTLLKGYVYDKQPLKDGETVRSGERVETLITIEAKNNYEYLIFEDMKPAGLEAVAIRSGESLYAKELKSSAVQRRYAEGASAAATVKPAAARVADRAAGRRAALRPVSHPVPAAEESEFTGRTRWVYQELRDLKVALFIDKLPEGVWEIRYDFRAEVPGQFHALPVVGYAMYVPEIRANGEELRLRVEDVQP